MKNSVDNKIIIFGNILDIERNACKDNSCARKFRGEIWKENYWQKFEKAKKNSFISKIGKKKSVKTIIQNSELINNP